jgi:hypothetical protein
MFRFAIFFFLVICSDSVRAGIGADMPWTTYEAEDMCAINFLNQTALLEENLPSLANEHYPVLAEMAVH